MRHRFTVGLLPGILLALISPLGMAGEHDAADWLERMIRSAHQLNYTGTFVYQQDGSLQSMKIIHAVNESGERERLISLTGPNREVVRDRERVTCILPEDEPIVVEHTGTPRPFPVTLPRELEPLRDYYEIRLEGGEERVAGVAARKVVIVPRDGYRYGQHFWLAADSGLLLRADVVNEEGKIVEQVMFTSLEVHDEIPASMLEPNQSADTRVVELQRQPKAPAGGDAPLWRVTDLPPGFSQQLQRNHYLPEKRFPVEHHVYSDGLASVSVFIEKRVEDSNAFVGASSMGGVNAYGRLFGAHTVTVLGEVPLQTVEQIALSLEQVAP